jgi:hypothetical protein
MTTTTHRPNCPRPGWAIEPSRTLSGVTIARCLGCGCVEIRTGEDDR